MNQSDTSYQVRQAQVEDWPEIDDFIRRTYGSGAHFKRRARWNWQFCNAPYSDGAGTSVPVWIALHGDRVVGQIALQPGLLWLAGEPVPAGWIVDVMVDEHHRGKGLSHKITDAMVATGQLLVTLTMAVATRRMMERVGCITLPPVRQMVRVGRLSGQTMAVLLDRIAENRPAWRQPLSWFVGSRIGPAALAATLSATAAISRPTPPTRPDSGWRKISAPDRAAVDHLSKRLAGTGTAHFDRSPEFFEWRFSAAPDLPYQFAELPGASAARALLVWREPLSVELPVGTITDILCDPDDAEAIGAAIDHAIASLRGGCEAIIAGASDTRFVECYAARGFRTVKTHLPTVVCNDLALLERIAKFNGTWHFSKADHDWDQVHPTAH